MTRVRGAGRSVRVGVLALLCVLLSDRESRGQSMDPARMSADSLLHSPVASPLLPSDHWAVRAARRADAAGLAPGILPPAGSASRYLVGVALLQAAQATSSRSYPLGDLAQEWYERYVEEYPEMTLLLRGAPLGVDLLGSAAGAEYVTGSGRSAPGKGEAPFQTGASPLPDPIGGSLRLRVAAAVGNHLSVDVAPELDRAGFRLAGGDLRLAWNAWHLAVGREAVGYGWARNGGVVLSGAVPLDRVAIATARPLALPGVLGLLGSATFHTFLSQLPEERHPGSPVLWGMSGSLRPHPRLLLAVHRAAMIGGERGEGPVTVGSILRTLVGKHAGVENQIVSGEVRYRLPTDGVVPLSAYCEWGAEDSAGAVMQVPGAVCGLLLPAVPGLPALAVGVERAYFGSSCCGNPPWYRHWAYPGAWSGSERPLGHPVGGSGTEWLGYTETSLLDARLHLQGRVFARERFEENLFVPGRDGASRGFEADVVWKVGSPVEVRIQTGVEAGTGWSERWLGLGAYILFNS